MAIHRVAASVATVLASVILTACGGDSPDNPGGVGTETNIYRGETITCIKDGSLRNAVRTCDFEKFYEAHPELLDEAADDIDNEGVWWTTYRGELMPCYKEGSLDSNTLSCDFVWFYNAHPALAGSR